MELYSLLTIGQSIIFTRVSFAPALGNLNLKVMWTTQKRDEADEIARRMSAEGHKVTSLHGQLEPADRDRIMDDFKNGRSKVLITTNVIARGIDILQVNVVVKWVSSRLSSAFCSQPVDQAYLPLTIRFQLRSSSRSTRQARCRNLYT